MIIPQEDDWVKCRNISVSPGKVKRVSKSSGVFVAIFLDAPADIHASPKGVGVPREYEIDLRDILTIIRDKARIDALNSELAGLACEI